MPEEIINLIKSFGPYATLLFLQGVLWFSVREKFTPMPWRDIIYSLYDKLKLSLDISCTHGSPCAHALILNLQGFKNNAPNHDYRANERVLSAFERCWICRVWFWISDSTDALCLLSLIGGILLFQSNPVFTPVILIMYLVVGYARMQAKDLSQMVERVAKEVDDSIRNLQGRGISIKMV